ncbi:MAG: thioredoxin [Lachnospiraceae bacterium]
MAAKALTNEEFNQEVLEKQRLTVVDFWAPWCTYCRRIEPAYEKIGSEYGDKFLIAKVNIDEEPKLAEKYQVEIIPTIMVFKNGEPVGQIVAPDSKAKIESFMAEHLGE